MIKVERVDQEKGVFEATGSSPELTIEIVGITNYIYNRLKEQNQKAAEYFKETLKSSINREDFWEKDVRKTCMSE